MKNNVSKFEKSKSAFRYHFEIGFLESRAYNIVLNKVMLQKRVRKTGPHGYKTFFMLIPAELEIDPAHKC